MAKWITVMIQKGEGCDYTIGCGTRAYAFEAPDIVAAKQMAINNMGMNEYFSGDANAEFHISGEQALHSWVLFEITKEADMLSDLKKAWTKFKESEGVLQKRVEIDQEKAEYERLKKKYGA